MGSFILHSSAAEISSGQSSIVETSNDLIGMFVNISSVSGTLPTLIIKLQQTPNGTDWYDVPGIVTASLGTVSLTSLFPSNQQFIVENIRIVWTIGGVSPSFTFKVEVATVG